MERHIRKMTMEETLIVATRAIPPRRGRPPVTKPSAQAIRA